MGRQLSSQEPFLPSFPLFFSSLSSPFSPNPFTPLPSSFLSPYLLLPFSSFNIYILAKINDYTWKSLRGHSPVGVLTLYVVSFVLFLCLQQQTNRKMATMTTTVQTTDPHTAAATMVTSGADWVGRPEWVSVYACVGEYERIIASTVRWKCKDRIVAVHTMYSYP